MDNPKLVLFILLGVVTMWFVAAWLSRHRAGFRLPRRALIGRQEPALHLLEIGSFAPHPAA
jgi:hypothetical protein